MVAAGTGPPPAPGREAPADGPWPRRRPFVVDLARYWWSQRRPRDAVSILTLYLVASFGIPSYVIFAPLGGGGTPSNLFGMGLLLWWVLEKMAGGRRLHRTAQPLRTALLVFVLAFGASMTNLFLRPATGKEINGVFRGAFFFAGLVGALLFAADGIRTVDRALALLRRTIHATTGVAVVGIVEFFTKVNLAQKVPYPGLVWNFEYVGVTRASFVRVRSAALHPIELGTLLGLMLPIAIHVALEANRRAAPRPGRRGLRRLDPRATVAWIEVTLIALVLPMALSRSGVIATVFGMAALVVRWPWSRRAKGLVVLGLFSGVLRVAIPGLMGSLVALFTNIFQDNSTTGRTSRYGIAGEYFSQHPWFGRGYNTLYPVTNQVFDNSYLYLAIETGIVGLLATLALFVVLIGVSRGLRLRTADPGLQGLSALFAASSLAMAILFFTADMLSFAMLMQCFFVLGGISGALWRLTGGPERRVLPRAVRRSGRDRPRPRAEAVAGRPRVPA